MLTHCVHANLPLLKVWRNVPLSYLIFHVFCSDKIKNCGSGIQNGAGWPLWIWFQMCSCITENLNFLNCVKLKYITRPLQNTICQLQPDGLKVSPCSYLTISDTSQSLLKKYPYFLLASILILTNNFCDLLFLPIYMPPLFCNAMEHNPDASWICVSWAIVLSVAGIKLFPVPLIDCYQHYIFLISGIFVLI